MRRASSGLLFLTLLCGCTHRRPMAPPKAVAVEPVSAAMTAEPPPPAAPAPRLPAPPPPEALPQRYTDEAPRPRMAAARRVPMMAAPNSPADLASGVSVGSASPRHAASSPPMAGPTVSLDEATAAEQWRDSLPMGGLKHHIDSVMELQKPATVTVTIEGDKAAPTAPEVGESAPVTLKVSPEMVVTLTAPGYEDQFKISPDTPQQKMVLHDGSTVWTWTVTPQHEGDGQLQIDAYVLYKDEASHQIPLPSIREKVHVRSIPTKTFLERGWDWVQENPGQSLKYILPGGAGAAMLHQLWLWWQRRRKRSTGGAVPTEDVS